MAARTWATWLPIHTLVPVTDIITGMPAEVLKKEGAGAEVVTSVCLSPDWRLASANLDGAVKLWDVGAATSQGRRSCGVFSRLRLQFAGAGAAAAAPMVAVWQLHACQGSTGTCRTIRESRPPSSNAQGDPVGACRISLNSDGIPVLAPEE
jgi:WD40 repeat protein